MREFIRMAFGSLGANKLRTFLSVLGIVIGTASVIIMVSVGTGAQRSIMQSIDALGSNLITVTPGSSRGRSGQLSQEMANVFTLDLAKHIEQTVPGVRHVVPTVQSSGLAIYQDRNVRVPFVGVTPAYEHVINHHPLIGRYVRDRDLEENARVVVLGSRVATDLFEDEIPIGKEIRLSLGGRRLSFVVVGVMEEKGQVLFSNYDNQILVPVTTLLTRGLNTRFVNGYAVQAESSDVTKDVADGVTFLLTRRLGNPNAFNVMNQETLLETATAATATMTILLGAIASIALLVGGIGIMNIMLVTVSERTREIGIRKALGAKRRHILMQFLLESVTLSGAGGCIGLATGWGGGWLIARATAFPFAVSMTSAVVAIGFSTVVGLFFGIYPAAKGSRLDPVVALRNE